tara:strand:+ start:3342 stop:3524 length:183 start_codon:yes stop_codon:yes gene_type:complete
MAKRRKIVDRLIIQYNDLTNRQLEDDLNKVLENYGLKEVGSGFCFRSRVRDIEYKSGGNE